MYIKNATYKTVPTGSLSFPLAEGAVVTAGGVTGIVPENLAAAGPTAQIYVAVGGTIDLTSEANKGVSFTDAQIKALGSDFNFVPASEKELPTPTLADAGKVVAVNETGTEYELVESGGGLPEYGVGDGGKVLTVNNSGNGVEWKHDITYVSVVSNSPYTIDFSFMLGFPAVHGTAGDRPDLEMFSFLYDFNINKGMGTYVFDLSCLTEISYGYAVNMSLYLCIDIDLAPNISDFTVNGNVVDLSSLQTGGVWTGTQWDSNFGVFCIPITGDTKISYVYND